MNSNTMIISGVSDDPLTSDIASSCGQAIDYSDIISLKLFSNGEFCPRFISDVNDLSDIGNGLMGKTIVIVSADSTHVNRNERSWRNCLLARAAKENGADQVVLCEPDLSFAAQDRGAREMPLFDGPKPRSVHDRKKFDGQPFSGLLYAQLLRFSGVDRVLTVHCHSPATVATYEHTFKGKFQNLLPIDVYARYIKESDVMSGPSVTGGVVLCAPDNGAFPFVHELGEALGTATKGVVCFDKVRSGERNVEISLSERSLLTLADVQGCAVAVCDDMIRTGATIRNCCSALSEAGASRIVFFATHFHSSREVRENLNVPIISEIVTTDTIPTILNRDQQGRLRHKMTVLKLGPWVARHLSRSLDMTCPLLDHMPAFYVDMSSKNPRYRPPREWRNMAS